MKITYLHITIIAYFLTDTVNMVAAATNFRGDLKISDQNNCGGGPEQKIKFGGELNLRESLKF